LSSVIFPAFSPSTPPSTDKKAQQATADCYNASDDTDFLSLAFCFLLWIVDFNVVSIIYPFVAWRSDRIATKETEPMELC
jgi:hypothetical protein